MGMGMKISVEGSRRHTWIESIVSTATALLELYISVSVAFWSALYFSVQSGGTILSILI